MSVCWYISIFLYSHILTFLCSELLIICHLCDLAYPLFYSFTSFINPVFYILILNQYKSPFSIYTILFIRFIILIFFSIFLSLKNLISKSLIRGILYSVLIWWPFLFLIPLIRSLASKHYAYIVLVILSLGEIMPMYSRCTKKKLVCIIIIAPFSCQPFSYFKYTKLNIHLFYNVRLILNVKYL